MERIKAQIGNQFHPRGHGENTNKNKNLLRNFTLYIERKVTNSLNRKKDTHKSPWPASE